VAASAPAGRRGDRVRKCHIRFGSKGDVTACRRHVRFTLDSVAKVSWIGSQRNVRSAPHSVLNLPCHVNTADESMLRAS
jgi:hypothetical protein